jgi:hypothetical protein
MARFKDQAFVQGAFIPLLQPGERVLYTAYGIKRPSLIEHLLLRAGLLCGLHSKKYIVGLTDRGRFLALHFSGKLDVKEVREYFIGNVVGVVVKTGPLCTRINIQEPYRPFSAKFHRLGTPWNRPHAIAIAQSLERRQITALPPG